MNSIWEILTSVGTLAAVGVALWLGVYPIRRAKKERDQQAWIVREHVFALLLAIWARSNRPFKDSSDRLEFEEVDREYMQEFTILYPQLILLPAEEMSEISTLFYIMKMSFAFGALTVNDSSNIKRTVTSVLKKAHRLG
jgi:hypothetical protein